MQQQRDETGGLHTRRSNNHVPQEGLPSGQRMRPVQCCVLNDAATRLMRLYAWVGDSHTASPLIP
jgi:hypothetical protein